MDRPAWAARDFTHFFNSTGGDVFDVHRHFALWAKDARPGGYDLFELAAKSAPATRISLAGQAPNEPPLLNLASYNYLGLAQRPEVIEAAVRAVRHYGLGAAGAPPLSGQLRIHDELAAALARFKQTDQALLFPSGYSGNLGIISALVKPGDHVITDQYAHASIFDGITLSGARLVLYRHNDMASLESRLRRAKGRVLVIAEGVYSMDGDLSPLPDIATLCRQYKARLMVDEAHSAFVYGEHGRGVVEHFGVEDAVDVHFGTLSKSLGGIGGYVAGSQELIDYLRVYARSQVFSCAMAPAVAGGVLKALQIAEAEPQLRQQLWRNVAVMRQELDSHGVDTGRSNSQIIPVMINDDVLVFDIVRDLMQAGIYLNPVRYPAVGVNRSRLRISVSASHQAHELQQAAGTIARVLRERRVLR